MRSRRGTAAGALAALGVAATFLTGCTSDSPAPSAVPTPLVLTPAPIEPVPTWRADVLVDRDEPLNLSIVGVAGERQNLDDVAIEADGPGRLELLEEGPERRAHDPAADQDDVDLVTVLARGSSHGSQV